MHCGGGGLGWSGGGALGIKLTSKVWEGAGKDKMVVQNRGGWFVAFSVLSRVCWISGRYRIPVSTVVLNNRGTPSSVGSIFILIYESPADITGLECTPSINASYSSRWTRVLRNEQKTTPTLLLTNLLITPALQKLRLRINTCSQNNEGESIRRNVTRGNQKSFLVGSLLL
jgi:hypothetical protein